jgi:medium-chain acyl-[acyl-carrier-protein] hydrolase
LGPWIAHSRPNPQSRLRLFCFPFAGGGASTYKSWVDALPAVIEVCPIQLPGREGRLADPPFKRMQPLVDAISEIILQMLDKPFAFFGHSMGARISFELARRLVASHNQRPVHLFVSACPSPQLPSNVSTYDLPDDKLIERLRTLNGTPSLVMNHPGVLRMLLPCIRADFETYDTSIYSLGPALDCPITAFGGTEDAVVNPGQLAHWRDLTTSSFSLHVLKGHHFFLHENQPLILKIVSAQLDRLLGPSIETAPAIFPHDGRPRHLAAVDKSS